MVTQAAPSQADLRGPGLRQWLALAVVLAGTFLVELDLSIVNVALQPIRTRLGAGVTEMELVISGYTLAFGLTLVTGGRLGDIFGYRRLFVVGAAAFSAASLACALAWAPVPLIGFRVLQGSAAGLMLPQTLSLIQLEFSGRHRARAFGLFGAVTGIAAIIGQTAGGLLIGLDIAGLSWRTVFLINLPIGLGSIIGTLSLLPKAAKNDRPSLDLCGVGLLTVPLLCVIAPLVFGGGAHGHPLSLLLTVLAVPGTVAFLRWEDRLQRRHRLPLLPPALLRHRNFRAGTGISLTFVTGNIGLFFLIALYFQGPLGFSPLKAGLLFTPLALCFGVASLVAPKLGRKAGHHVLTIGYGINTVGTAALLGASVMYGQDLPEAAIVVPLAVIGFGEGLGFTPLMDIVLAGVPPRDAGSASGALETGIQIGAALGPAVLGTVYSATSDFAWGLTANLVLAAVALVFVPMLSPKRREPGCEENEQPTAAASASVG